MYFINYDCSILDIGGWEMNNTERDFIDNKAFENHKDRFSYKVQLEVLMEIRDLLQKLVNKK